MSKTVGIITIHKICNYGSALQTFGTFEVLKGLGYEPAIIDYHYPTEYHKKLYFGSGFKQEIKTTKNLFTVIKRQIVKYILSKKRKKFDNFLNKHVIMTRAYESIEDIHANPPEFDIYLTGSDQVWNPRYLYQDTTFLLSFAPDKAKKIAYSASFGSSELSPDYVDLYKSFLVRYSHIAVRETSGVSIIKRLIGKDAVHVLDPTFLLPASKLSAVASKRLVKQKYILCYILGYSFNPYPYATKLIEHIRKLTGYKIVTIDGNPREAFRRGYTNFSDAGPEDFLALFRDAEFVVTSSFHGTAFSINFAKPFFSIINNEKTSDDRQLSIMKQLGLEDRAIVKGAKMPDYQQLKIDYITPYSVLEQARKTSLEYLKNALER